MLSKPADVATGLEQVVILRCFNNTRSINGTDVLHVVPTRLFVLNKLRRAYLLSSSCQQLVMRRRYQMSLVAMLFALCYKIITTCPRLVNNWPLETSS